MTAKHVPSEHLLSSSDYLSVVRDFALSKGISIETLLRDSDLSPSDFINPPKLVNNFIVTKVGINLYNELSNPLCETIEFGLCMTASSHGSLGIAVQCAANLNEAYSILKAFYNTRINSQDIQMERETSHLKVFLKNKYEMTEDKALQRFYDLATLFSIAINTLRALDQSRLKGQIIINVDAQAPESFPYHLLNGTHVVFDQPELNMLIPQAWLEIPLSIANPDISKAAVEKCEDEMKLLCSSDLIGKVRIHLQQIEGSMPSLSEIAEQFHMSSATFKRKLKEKETTYQALKDDVRIELATKLIRDTDKSFEDIAEILGYSDASNFTKAFKSWLGLTPKAFRHNLTEVLSTNKSN